MNIHLHILIKLQTVIEEKENYYLLQNKEIRVKYNDVIRRELGGFSNVDWATLANAMKTANKDVLTVKSNPLAGWYEMSKNILTPLIKQRSRVINRIRQDKSIPRETAKEMCQTTKTNLLDTVTLAKSKWATHLAKKVHSLRLNPKEAWQAVKDLKKGITGHHVAPTTMHFRMKNGKTIKN